MRISLTEAKSQLTELVRRAEAGEEVILTRHGHAAVRLEPVSAQVDMDRRRRVLEAFLKPDAAKPVTGPSAARSQDFLYDGNGLPD